jgi:alkaline phosphatase
MNFGQRYLELETTYIKDEDKDDITLNVAQMPPNANIFQPGPAYIFLVVDGIPSQGEIIMIGSGNIEEQSLLAKTVLPQSQVIVGDKTSEVSSNTTSTDTAASGSAVNAAAKNSGSSTLALPSVFQTILLSLTFGIAAFIAI